MQSDNSPELLADDSAAARRVGTVLVVLAALALAGNCLLNSPGRFSEAHAQDTSLLKPVVTALGKRARPNPRPHHRHHSMGLVLVTTMGTV